MVEYGRVEGKHGGQHSPRASSGIDAGFVQGGKLLISVAQTGGPVFLLPPPISLQYPHVEQRLLRWPARVSSAGAAAAILPSCRFELNVPISANISKRYYLGPPQGGYYPQQPQQAYQGGYGGQPGFQQQPQSQPVYVYVRPPFGFKLTC